MLKVAELIELADLFDSRGFFKAADLCDEIIATAADVDIKQYPEINLIRDLAKANFESIKPHLRLGIGILTLTQDKTKVDDVEISYVKGSLAKIVNGMRLDPQSAATLFEEEKGKIGPEDAVLYVESGNVRFLYPPQNMHVLKDFFNQKVNVKQDPQSAFKDIVRKYKGDWEEEEDTIPEHKGVGGVNIF